MQNFQEKKALFCKPAVCLHQHANITHTYYTDIAAICVTFATMMSILMWEHSGWYVCCSQFIGSMCIKEYHCFLGVECPSQDVHTRGTTKHASSEYKLQKKMGLTYQRRGLTRARQSHIRDQQSRIWLPGGGSARTLQARVVPGGSA